MLGNQKEDFNLYVVKLGFDFDSHPQKASTTER